jgi:hypothetical protein
MLAMKRRPFLAVVLMLASVVRPAMAGEGRPPKDKGEMRYWLENMVWHHRFSVKEVAAAMGMGVEDVRKAMEELDVREGNRPKVAAGEVRVLPYPGGRHPRIGFLEGAVRPQRETKVSVFAPWAEGGYAVVDVPEAIFTNLGLIYLAHTHVQTVWEKEGKTLEPLEWNRRADGSLDIERTLPNGIAFGTKVWPEKGGVGMELWLRNGTKERLTGLKVQNCVMLKGLSAFEGQTNENKVLKKPAAAARAGKRWVITAWERCDRVWANEKCPCFHSDPKFADCAPGETVRARGVLRFYEGEDGEAEMARVEGLLRRGAQQP